MMNLFIYIASIIFLNLNLNTSFNPHYPPFPLKHTPQQTENSFITLDNIENQYAFLEIDGQIFQLPIKALPPNAKEGDIIHLEINNQQTSTFKEKASNRIARIEQKSIQNSPQTSYSPINL